MVWILRFLRTLQTAMKILSCKHSFNDLSKLVIYSNKCGKNESRIAAAYKFTRQVNAYSLDYQVIYAYPNEY